MTLTVLIDLDDTLLINNVDRFLDNYFKALGKALSPYVRPDRMMAAMSEAVRAMLSKKDPAKSLEETFNEEFYPGIGVPQSELISVIDQFYQAEFPRLKPLTSQNPAAIELIRSCFHRGWQVVVATNPLFPATAIHQRLTWAGLSPQEYPFALITDFSSSHYSKPHHAYYAEILANLRWPDGPVVMVGNDFDGDILPAEGLGLPTYWLCENSRGILSDGRHPLSAQGTMDKLEAWLVRVESANQAPNFESQIGVTATLLATPAALSNIVMQLDQSKWNLRPKKDEWSLTEILCHLRDVDREVDLPRIQAVLDGTNPFIPGAVTDPWVDERNYGSECGTDSLKGFMDIRTEITRLLESLEPDDWQQSARHAIFGPTTLLEMINFIAIHDRTHTKQIWQTIQDVSGY